MGPHKFNSNNNNFSLVFRLKQECETLEQVVQCWPVTWLALNTSCEFISFNLTKKAKNNPDRWTRLIISCQNEDMNYCKKFINKNVTFRPTQFEFNVTNSCLDIICPKPTLVWHWRSWETSWWCRKCLDFDLTFSNREHRKLQNVISIFKFSCWTWLFFPNRKHVLWKCQTTTEHFIYAIA